MLHNLIKIYKVMIKITKKVSKIAYYLILGVNGETFNNQIEISDYYFYKYLLKIYIML